MGKRRNFQWGQWVGFLLLIPSLILNIFLYQKIQREEPGIKVIGVIDGDTLVLEGKVRVRLRSVDAPELEFCGGKEAKKILSDLVLGKEVALKEKIIDTMGRPLALVYLGDTLINEEVLKSGWAKFHGDSNTKREILKKAYEEARGKSLGVFSPKCRQMTNPDNPKCNIKGNIDRNRKKYYFPGCVQYDYTVVEKDIGEAWFCTEEEARKAGFEKSERCPGKTYSAQ